MLQTNSNTEFTVRAGGLASDAAVEQHIQNIGAALPEELDIPGFGKLSVTDSVLFVLARLGILGQDQKSTILTDSAVKVSQCMSDKVVKLFMQETSNMLKANTDLERAVDAMPLGRLVVASSIAADKGHDGQLRDSMPLYPYRWHPSAMQGRAELAFMQSTPSPTQYEREELRLIQALCAVHDIVEILFEKRKGLSFFTEEHILTPQDFGNLARAYGAEDELAHQLTQDNLSMIKLPEQLRKLYALLRPRSGLGSIYDKSKQEVPEISKYLVGVPEEQKAAQFQKLLKNIEYILSITPRGMVGKGIDVADNGYNLKASYEGIMPPKYRWAFNMIPQLLDVNDGFYARFVREAYGVPIDKARGFYIRKRDVENDLLTLFGVAA